MYSCSGGFQWHWWTQCKKVEVAIRATLNHCTSMVSLTETVHSLETIFTPVDCISYFTISVCACALDCITSALGGWIQRLDDRECSSPWEILQRFHQLRFHLYSLSMHCNRLKTIREWLLLEVSSEWISNFSLQQCFAMSSEPAEGNSYGQV